MDASHPINRLTEREKEVLRAWLNHKSAKEIALDLGITHHAVEKRLKMARTKLDAGSSLEAARMLAQVEGASEGASAGYGQAVTTAPDLAPAPPQGPSRRYRPIVFGGIAMSLAIILALALTTGGQPSAADEDLAAVTAAASSAAAKAQSTEIEIDGDLGKLFAHHDTNDSGFLESPESPLVEITFLDDTGPERLDGAAAISGGAAPDQIAEFYASADTDGDDRISLAEFTDWSKARWAEMGIEVKTIIKVLPAPES
jgi:DNA-binding CsgD family transcriptional regulator